MTLDSYLRDLLGGSSAAQVKIVTDNAFVQQDEESSTRMGITKASSCREVRRRSSRWENVSRRNSDSALGKPQRRSSADDEDIRAAANALIIAEAENLEDDLLKDTSPSQRMPPLRRTFSDLPEKRTKQSEQRSINNTHNALHRIRSRPQSAAQSSGVSSQQQSRRLRDILGAIVSSGKSSSKPPSKPTRTMSGDITLARETQSPKGQIKRTQSAPPKGLKAGRAGMVSMDIPESLRELPYPTTTSTT
jgi:hypothetical protein